MSGATPVNEAIKISMTRLRTGGRFRRISGQWREVDGLSLLRDPSRSTSTSRLTLVYPLDEPDSLFLFHHRSYPGWVLACSGSFCPHRAGLRHVISYRVLFVHRNRGGPQNSFRKEGSHPL